MQTAQAKIQGAEIREREVPDFINKLKVEVDYLMKNISVLRQRLDPVIQEYPETECSNTVSPSSLLCPVASEIRDVFHVVGEANRQIQKITDSLEV